MFFYFLIILVKTNSKDHEIDGLVCECSSDLQKETINFSTQNNFFKNDKMERDIFLNENENGLELKRKLQNKLDFLRIKNIVEQNNNTFFGNFEEKYNYTQEIIPKSKINKDLKPGSILQIEITNNTNTQENINKSTLTNLTFENELITYRPTSQEPSYKPFKDKDLFRKIMANIANYPNNPIYVPQPSYLVNQQESSFYKRFFFILLFIIIISIFINLFYRFYFKKRDIEDSNFV